jgi:hypothetical protein
MEYNSVPLARLGRRTQVAKGEVCKTSMQRFKSARRLHLLRRMIFPQHNKPETLTGFGAIYFRGTHARSEPVIVPGTGMLAAQSLIRFPIKVNLYTVVMS